MSSPTFMTSLRYSSGLSNVESKTMHRNWMRILFFSCNSDQTVLIIVLTRSSRKSTSMSPSSSSRMFSCSKIHGWCRKSMMYVYPSGFIALESGEHSLSATVCFLPHFFSSDVVSQGLVEIVAVVVLPLL